MNNKLNYIILLILLIFAFIFFPIKTNKSILAEELYKNDFSNSTAEIIMDANSKRILHSKNINEKKYMASTTKILTAITVIEHCNISSIITVDKKTTGIEGSSIYLKEGEKLSVKDLLFGLMLRSGNDCAETLARYVSGSNEEFATLMNNTAKKIGANNSNFVNPHGLHDDNHYTTAYDLALISSYAMKNPVFREIVSTKKTKIPNDKNEYDRVLINKNKMLTTFDGANGIKTGFTKKAGRCLVTSCVRDGLELICVVLNCPPMFERSKELLSQSYENYKNYKLVESDYIIDFIKSDMGEIPIHIQNDIILPLTDEEYKNVKIKYDYPSKLVDFSAKEIGKIQIYVKNNLIFTEKIYTIL